MRLIPTFGTKKTIDPNDPTEGQTLDALMARQKSLMQQRPEAPQQIASPWQGAALMANTFVNSLQQSQAQEQEAAGRQQLAAAMMQRDAAGNLTPEAQATVMKLEPELGYQFIKDAIAARRAEDLYQRERRDKLTDVYDERTFTVKNEERINERERLEKEAADKAAAAAGAQRIVTGDEAVKLGGKPDRQYKVSADGTKLEDVTPTTDDKAFTNENTLRNQYNTLPVVKNLPTIQNAFERIQTGANDMTPAGDMALIYGFMKLQDPESVVREGEYATAENARGVEQGIMNLYNKIRTGQRLTPEQRAEFTALAGKQYRDYAAQVAETNKRYSGIATEWGIDPSRVIVAPKVYEEPKKVEDMTDEELKAAAGGGR